MTEENKTREQNSFERYAAANLPDGLRANPFEAALHRDDSKRVEKAEEADRITQDALESWAGIFEHLGGVGWSNPGQPSLLTPSSESCWRVWADFIASPDILDRWFRDSRGSYSLRKLHLRCPEGFRFGATKHKLYNTLRYRLDYESGEDFYFRNLDINDFKSAPDFAPTDFARWARAAQVSEKDLATLAELSEVCDGRIDAMAAALERANRKFSAPEFLVDGLIPTSAVTLMLGDHKTGKSTLATELAVAVARREDRWLDFSLNNERKGFAVCMLGEDSMEAAYERIHLMTGGETPPLLHVVPPNEGDMDSVLSALGKDSVRLLVIDPARKYLRGDEDSSDSVSEFMTKAENFSAKKRCSVLMTHHLRRNAAPRNVSDVPRHGRGSNVFFDRPRVTLGVHRNGDETQLGIAAPNGVPLHNFRQSTMFPGIRRLRRDEATHRHLLINVRPSSEAEHGVATSETERAYEAAARLIKAGERVTRTGGRGIFKRAPLETAGITRAATTAAVDKLVAQGRLRCDASGALSLPPVANHCVPID